MRDDGPSLTARVVALNRAKLDRPAAPSGDVEADERLSADLVEGWSDPRGEVSRVFGWVEARTGFFDDEVLAVIAAGISQVVIVGAGYDGRGLRFRTPGVTFFEVDHPQTQADKRARLERLGASTEGIVFVAHDLVEGSLGDALAAAGHASVRPTLFMAEGLLRYLPEATICHLFEATAARAAPGSVFALTFSTREVDAFVSDDEHRRQEILAATGEAVLTVPPRDVALTWIAAAGWQVTDTDEVESPLRSPGDARLLIRAVPGRP